MGPSYVHGLMQADVDGAPTFHEIAGDVLERLRGVILVAHNLDFDRGFLAAELTNEGIFLPSLPACCTLKLSYRLHPTLENHKLETCLRCVGIEEAPFHSALEDARVTARLVLNYVSEASRTGLSVTDLVERGRLAFPAEWPDVPTTERCRVRTARSTSRLDPPYIARLVADLAPIQVTEAVAPYLDLLDRALEDRRITLEEAHALEATAQAWGLSRDQVVGANLSYTEALVAAALEDSVVTGSERADLEDVARLLGVPAGTLDALVAAGLIESSLID